MLDYSLSTLITALFVLLLISGFFSLAETAMMAAARYRLKARAEQGEAGPRLAVDLLAQTDRLLGVILLFNNLINAAAATLTGIITIELFGDDKWALGAGTLVVTFLILVISEITPKVIGANHADRIAPAVSFVLAPLLRAFAWVVSFVNVFVSGILSLLRLQHGPTGDARPLTTEELRAIVLDSSPLMPQKHRSILMNLFELEDVTVEDVMTPRSQIEAIDLSAPVDEIREKLATSYHTRIPVYDEDPNNVLGILHLRRAVGILSEGELDKEDLRERLAQPYFIPSTTRVYEQLQYFQENLQRVALVVDEYGEIQGLVTLEDVVEELIGKFTTSTPGPLLTLAWDEDGTVLVEGSRPLRELNRKLALNLPRDGPKTLNGLILEHFQDIPESGMSVKVGDVPIEIVQTQDRMVKTARIHRPAYGAGNRH